MMRALLLPTVIFLICGCDATIIHTVNFDPINVNATQTSVIEKADETETPDIVSLQLHCGWAGYTSPVIVAYKKLIGAKNYHIIKEKLRTGTLTEKVLSAMAIQKLKTSGLIILTAAEEKKYNTIISSGGKVEACYTCTGQFEGSINKFFHPQRKGDILELTLFGTIMDELFSE